MTPERDLLKRLVEADAIEEPLAAEARDLVAQFGWVQKVEAAAEKYRELLAQPERPQWTDTPPELPGWYWWRKAARTPISALFGDADYDGDGTIQHWWNGANRLIYGPPDGQWCGPIEPPEE